MITKIIFIYVANYPPGNERGPTLENDYLESDDRVPSDSTPVSAIPVAMTHDNQQDVSLRINIAHHKHFRPGPWPYACFLSLCVCTFDLVTGLLLLQAVRVGSVCTNSGEFQFLTAYRHVLYYVHCHSPKSSLAVIYYRVCIPQSGQLFRL